MPGSDSPAKKFDGRRVATKEGDSLDHTVQTRLTYLGTGVLQGGGGQGGQLPPQILADQKAPPGSGGAPHYYLPPRIFDPCGTPAWG